MTTVSPDLFPQEGLCRLTPKEHFERVKAISRTLPKTNKPICSAQISVGIFFDGTGNNRDKDYVEPPPEERKHSNIVRLFHTYRSERKEGYFRFYVPGVGTPFPEVGDSGKSWSATAGSAAAWKGEHRIAWALVQLLNAPHIYVTNAPLIQPDQEESIVSNAASLLSPGSYRRLIIETWQKKLKETLNRRLPTIEQINLSVFGFSRGAAQARTFVNWLFELCKKDGDRWTFAGIPLEV